MKPANKPTPAKKPVKKTKALSKKRADAILQRMKVAPDVDFGAFD